MYMNSDTIETIGKVNRLIAAWPTDDMVPVDGFESVKTTHKRLSSALNEIRNTAEKEVR
jgi:SAGA-associated factor 29